MPPSAKPQPPPIESVVLHAARPLLATVAHGVRLARSGRFEETVTLLEDTRWRLRGHPAAELAPVLPGVLTDLGLAQSLCGRFGPAEENLHEAQALAEERGLSLLDTVARQNQGCLALYRGDSAGAIDTFLELTHLVPFDRQEALRVDLAEALLCEGLVEEAGRTLAEAPWRDELTGTARTLVEAKLHLLEGDHRAALHMIRRVRRRTGPGSLWYGLASRLERSAERTRRDHPLDRAHTALEWRSPTSARTGTDLVATRALTALAERTTDSFGEGTSTRLAQVPVQAPAPVPGTKRVGPTGRAPLPGPWLGAGINDPHVLRAGLEGALAAEDPAAALEWAELVRPVAGAKTLASMADRSPGTDPAMTRPWVTRTGARHPGPVLGRLFDTLGDRAFVHYTRAADQAVALVAVAGRVRAVPLGPLLRTRRSLARLRHEYATVAAGNGVVRALTEVDAALVGPVSPLVEDRALVVTGDAYLDDPPWGLLPGLRGRPLTVVTGARAWTGRGCHTGPRVLLASGPEPAGASAEVRALSGIYPGARVLERARRRPVLDALAGADMAHLAGHGHADERSALLSRVELADGPLLAHDLVRLRTPPVLVTLATCWGGRGFLTRFPGGFAGTLVAMGTRTVVAGPLPIADERTGTAMRAFHRALAAGGEGAEAG
ncbi:CHAT domain-containing protein, partial [Nocardiopsis alkaliphila]|uniref:CHAT domain-containing protein n=1 Tax=Nocardiopsis alkaliphila TaxID=225762 RepID=UPI00037D1DFA